MFDFNDKGGKARRQAAWPSDASLPDRKILPPPRTKGRELNLIISFLSRWSTGHG